MGEKQDNASMGTGVKLMLAMGALLLVATVVIGVINFRQLKKEQAYSESTRITVMQNGEQRGVIEGGDVVRIQPVEFTLEGDKFTYTGVALSAVLEQAGFSLDQVEQVTVRGTGTSSVTLPAAELLEQEHIYLVYGRDGAPLELPVKGGEGPFLLIPRKDQERSRWVGGASVVELS